MPLRESVPQVQMPEQAEPGLNLSELTLWIDTHPRGGYENMAADELLLRHPQAWLRIYRWKDSCVSFGYFDTSTTARSLFPGAAHYIRRWTGGGIVDHRHGITYTLTLPSPPPGAPQHPCATVLYRRIHSALASALRACGVNCRLLLQDAPSGGRACWSSPVTSDIVDASGHKLAGAGQRRFRGAVLHQGLIQQCTPSPGWEMNFAAQLSPKVNLLLSSTPWSGFEESLNELCSAKYLTAAWEDESHGRRNLHASAP